MLHSAKMQCPDIDSRYALRGRSEALSRHGAFASLSFGHAIAERPLSQTVAARWRPLPFGSCQLLVGMLFRNYFGVVALLLSE